MMRKWVGLITSCVLGHSRLWALHDERSRAIGDFCDSLYTKYLILQVLSLILKKSELGLPDRNTFLNFKLTNS